MSRWTPDSSSPYIRLGAYDPAGHSDETVDERQLILCAVYVADAANNIPCMEDGRFYRNPRPLPHRVWTNSECSKYYLCLGEYTNTFQISTLIIVKSTPLTRGLTLRGATAAKLVVSCPTFSFQTARCSSSSARRGCFST